MGERADLLELIDLAPGPLITLRARWVTWRHLGRCHAALQRDGSRVTVMSSGGAGLPEEQSISRDVVLEPPNRWRITSEEHIDVTDGISWWTGLPGFVTKRRLPDDLARHQLTLLLRPGELMGSLRFGKPDAVDIERRSAWRVDAAPRGPGSRGRPSAHLIWELGGDDHMFWVDRLTGIVLRHEGRIDGEPAARTELLDVIVDEPIDPTTFTVVPDDTTVVQTEAEELLRWLEQRGIDPGDVDPTDVDALRTLMFDAPTSPDFEFATAKARRGNHVPTGPPPNDREAAESAIHAALAALGETAEDGTTLVNVQAGTGLAPLLANARQRVPGITDDDHLVVDDVKFLAPDRAVVWYSLHVGGAPHFAVSRREGQMVLIDERWVLERASATALLSLAGVNAPPVGEG